MKPREIAVIRWLDSASLDPHWMGKDSAKECSPEEVLSVGLLISEVEMAPIGSQVETGQDGHVVIALSETEHQFGGLLAIPVVAIKDMRLLQDLVEEKDDA